MAMSTCPRCGTPVQPNATMCTACGFDLTASSDSPPPATASTPPTPDPAPVTDADPAETSSTSSTTARAAAAGEAVRAGFDATLERWGVEQTPVLIGGLVLAVIAVLVSSFAVTTYLTAGDADFLQKLDAQVWMRFALGFAIAGAALLVLARWQSPFSGAVSGERNPDLTVGFVLSGMTVAFSVAGLFKGLDESFEATDAWFSYANVFAVVTLGWFAISRSVPATIGTISTMTLGIAAVVVGIITLIIGQIQGLSEDNSTYISGLAFQGVGTVAVILALGWFLGLRPKGRRLNDG